MNEEYKNSLNKTQQSGEKAGFTWNFQAPEGTYLQQFQSAATTGGKLNAAAAGGIAGLSGLTGILSNAVNASKIKEDTPWFDARVDELNRVGSTEYLTNEQVLNGYSNLASAPVQDYDEVRNMTSGQKLANAGSSILQGASTGFSIGGWWGALAGGVVGGLASLEGIRQGDEKARLKVMEDNMNSQIAMNNANMNLAYNLQRVKNLNYRDDYANVGKDGGKMERKQMSIRDFADIATGRKRDYPVRIARVHCNGGVKIKINR